MQIIDVTDRTQAVVFELTNLWEQSVRATHDFLSEQEIAEIKKYVPQALRQVPHLTVATDNSGTPVGFIGTSGSRIEMLFVAPEMRSKGIGKALLQYVSASGNITEVTVNEQNPRAVGFYAHMGFKTYKRTPLDEQGHPYPLLYMRLS